MLPLWIIDITKQSDRQGSFKDLVGQIEHVHIAPLMVPKAMSEHADLTAIPVVPLVEPNESVEKSENSEIPAQAEEEIQATLIEVAKESVVKGEQTTKEIIEEEERRIAEKNAIIEGNYWYYTSVQSYFEGVDQENAESVAKALYAFQSDLVAEGQRFIHMIRQSNAKPYQTINIMVIGDVTEEFTRIVFPSIAAMLQKEKGRMLPHHIHQGIEIMGMLFVPCNINALDVSDRESIKRTLTEIQVQHQLSSIRGYDHMILYQDVQNRAECSYTILNAKQQAEYLLQCVVHLFLACDKTHPLISGTASADIFYLSMGAASVFYDMKIEDERERIRLENEIIRNFKDRGIAEKTTKESFLISEDDYSPYNFFHGFSPDVIELEDVEPDDPSPWHPIRNFFAKKLKRYYYQLYLRFFPADYYHKIVAQVEEKTRGHLEIISAESKRKFTDAEKRMPKLIQQKIETLDANDGGLPNIVSSLKDMQAKLSNNRTVIRPYLNRQFWPTIEKEFIDSSLEDPFYDYHDVYNQDIKVKNEGSGCETLKKEAKGKLQQLLSHETTLLSAIGRCVLGGIIFAIALIPVLANISPVIIDLGDVRKHYYWWVLLLFFIPAIIELCKYWHYQFKKGKLLTVLKAYYLHDAYARIANRIDSEINAFYDRLIELCNAYIERCQSIRKEISLTPLDGLADKLEVPITKFNQPLAGGVFGTEKLLPSEKNDDCEVKVNYIRKNVNTLTKADYYLLINQFHNDFELLFKDVRLTENFIVRQNEETGEEELVTKAQQEKELISAWENNKVLFRKELKDSVEKIMIPRKDQTVADKLITYSRIMRRQDILEPFIEFAACNGEIISTADTEFADVKTNREEIEKLTRSFLPVANTKYQFEKYDAICQKYIFVTRWRSFDHFSFNRILPTEDFDMQIRSQRVCEDKETDEKENEKSVRLINISSIVLWALCPDDTSSEWFNLFKSSEQFKEAYEMREIYRKTLNKND